MNDEKINNFTNGGSDTKNGGRVPQGSDTRIFYTKDRNAKTRTFATGTESVSGENRRSVN